MFSLRIVYLFFFTVGVLLICYLNVEFEGPHNLLPGLAISQTQLLNVNKRFSSVYVNSPLYYNRSRDIKVTYGNHELLWWNEPLWMKDSKWNAHCNLSLCEYPNCVVITDKARKKQSSVIIVSVADKGGSNAPQARKDTNQALVIYSLECAKRLSKNALRKWSGHYTWSMTHRRNADIFTPYGRLEDKSPQSKDYSAIFRSKKKQVAWIVSNCHTVSKREEYVKKLQEYIQVDIYGGCGRPIDEDSIPRILSNYKFYLGFENALCTDYITEKYFHYLQYDLIVIVRGLTNYKELLPNRTFINTADFVSIESLGIHIKLLSDDENEYIRYLKEKDKYLVYDRERLYCDGLCSLCEKVNNLPESHKNHNIKEWVGESLLPSDLR